MEGEEEDFEILDLYRKCDVFMSLLFFFFFLPLLIHILKFYDHLYFIF